MFVSRLRSVMYAITVSTNMNIMGCMVGYVRGSANLPMVQLVTFC